MFDDPQFAQRVIDMGQEPQHTTPAGLTAYLRGESDRWSKVIKAAGLKIER
jgi:tripartite-type tricarboxylate transporter receptor subunit TctC